MKLCNELETHDGHRCAHAVQDVVEHGFLGGELADDVVRLERGDGFCHSIDQVWEIDLLQPGDGHGGGDPRVIGPAERHRVVQDAADLLWLRNQVGLGAHQDDGRGDIGARGGRDAGCQDAQPALEASAL